VRNLRLHRLRRCIAGPPNAIAMDQRPSSVTSIRSEQASNLALTQCQGLAASATDTSSAVKLVNTLILVNFRWLNVTSSIGVTESLNS